MELGKRLADFWAKFTGNVGFAIIIVLSIAVLAFAYFMIIRFLLKNNSRRFIYIAAVIMVISGLLFMFNDDIESGLYIFVPMILFIIIVVLYSVELKRSIWKKHVNKPSDIKHGAIVFDEEKIENCIAEIIKALQDMSKNDVGAIIVLANGNIPPQILDSGVKLDSDISSALIESVFFPKTPLHDGAMIIDGTKIVAAGCFLPLSQQVDRIPKDLGTRHRAGLGVTENIDVISLIVSEETGIITVARAGKIQRYADSEILKRVLTKYFWQDVESRR